MNIALHRFDFTVQVGYPIFDAGRIYLVILMKVLNMLPVRRSQLKSKNSFFHIIIGLTMEKTESPVFVKGYDIAFQPFRGRVGEGGFRPDVTSASLP